METNDINATNYMWLMEGKKSSGLNYRTDFVPSVGQEVPVTRKQRNHTFICIITDVSRVKTETGSWIIRVKKK